MFVWYILALVFALFALTEIYAWRTGVPTIASFPSARRAIMAALRDEFPESLTGLRVLDLGSGNGQLAASIARAFPESKIVGVEISLVPWALSWLRQKIFGPRNLHFERADFWHYDISHVDVVMTYLTENIIDRVGDKLRRELKTGAVVLANDTALRGDWVPTRTVETGFMKMKIFVYRQH